MKRTKRNVGKIVLKAIIYLILMMLIALEIFVNSIFFNGRYTTKLPFELGGSKIVYLNEKETKIELQSGTSVLIKQNSAVSITNYASADAVQNGNIILWQDENNAYHINRLEGILDTAVPTEETESETVEETATETSETPATTELSYYVQDGNGSVISMTYSQIVGKCISYDDSFGNIASFLISQSGIIICLIIPCILLILLILIQIVTSHNDEEEEEDEDEEITPVAKKQDLSKTSTHTALFDAVQTTENHKEFEKKKESLSKHFAKKDAPKKESSSQKKQEVQQEQSQETKDKIAMIENSLHKDEKKSNEDLGETKIFNVNDSKSVVTETEKPEEPEVAETVTETVTETATETLKEECVEMKTETESSDSEETEASAETPDSKTVKPGEESLDELIRILREEKKRLG